MRGRRYTYGDIRERVVLAHYDNLIMIGDGEGQVDRIDVSHDVVWTLRKPAAVLTFELLGHLEQERSWVKWLADRYLYVDADDDRIRPLSLSLARPDAYAIEVVKPMLLAARFYDPGEALDETAIGIHHETLVMQQHFVRDTDGCHVLTQHVAFDPWNRSWWIRKDGWRAYELKPTGWEIVAPFEQTPWGRAYERRSRRERKERQAYPAWRSSTARVFGRFSSRPRAASRRRARGRSAPASTPGPGSP
jgi:hypothetical protein